MIITAERRASNSAGQSCGCDSRHAQYAGEIAALDDLAPGEVVLVAAGGSARAACWGELFSTAARARGAPAHRDRRLLPFVVLLLSVKQYRPENVEHSGARSAALFPLFKERNGTGAAPRCCSPSF